jgi:nucleoside-diphosphate-sugar epimerase
VHINDCIKAFVTVATETKANQVNSKIFNIGSNNQNVQVVNVANLFKKYFPELNIEVSPDDPDSRSYNVNFDKATKQLNFKPTKYIEDGILEIKEALEKGDVMDDIKTRTLDYYRFLMEADKVLSSLKLGNRLF